MRTPLKYPGSKQRIANWIIEQLPEHHTYVEPFFGSGAVLFNKAPSNIETINDIDDRVINLFECILEDADRLVKIIELTPYARRVYDRSFEIVPKNKWERAAQFLVQRWRRSWFQDKPV